MKQYYTVEIEDENDAGKFEDFCAANSIKWQHVGIHPLVGEWCYEDFCYVVEEHIENDYEYAEELKRLLKEFSCEVVVCCLMDYSEKRFDASIGLDWELIHRDIDCFIEEEKQYGYISLKELYKILRKE